MAPTRAAAKRSGEVGQPAPLGIKSAFKASKNTSDGSALPSTKTEDGAKRKRATISEPVSGGWDVLPHGLGKKGDLADCGTIDQVAQVASNEDEHLPPSKRARRSTKSNDAAGEATDVGANGVKLEEPTTHTKSSQSLVKVEGADIEGDEKPVVETPTLRRSGRATKPVKVEAQEENLKVENFKDEKFNDEDSKDDDIKEEKPKKPCAPRKKKVVDTAKDVLDKADELDRSVPKKERKKKHKYGLTPGDSPFPDHVMPTAEACEEVNRLLSELHGEVKPPEVIPPPSMELAGCGEVPDLLDAVLRTRLSASTTAKNANMSLKGLKDKFGLRKIGAGKDSVNWEAVHEADLATVIDSIKSGGLAKIKGTSIKNILTMVYEQNRARRDELLKENESGEQADVLGADHETKRQKDKELARFEETLLTMDHVFELTTDEAMEELIKLPGIGVKTASCVILFCMKRASFAVDTHVWRHCKWLGWVPYTATRDQTFSHCEIRVPDHLKYSLHQLFLRHGKTCGRCRANASAGTKEWDETVCPIDHLVIRKEARKLPGSAKKTKSAGGKVGKKGKKADDETEESEVEVDAGSDDEGNEEDVMNEDGDGESEGDEVA